MRREAPWLAVAGLCCLAACHRPGLTPGPATGALPRDDDASPAPVAADARTPGAARPADWPRLVTHHAQDLDAIARVSRFRSGVGHDFSDGFERCRSMKHYFEPRVARRGDPPVGDWTDLVIRSPLAARVERIVPEWAGSQIWLRARSEPRLLVRLFHVRVAASLHEGSLLAGGEALGHHASRQTLSDLAVAWHDGAGERLISLFDVMAEEAFDAYRARGVAERSALVIPADVRDADPLRCVGQAFTRASRLPDWVLLRAAGEAGRP